MTGLNDSYRTVDSDAQAEICEKRSRFIAAVRPVQTEEEAIEFLEKIKKEHWGARHNVYAYVISENNLQRYSDDGEPAGTAGLPVLDCIRKEGLCNIAVVVTRYFGGILLGTGGLVRAYSAAAKAGIETACPVNMVLCRSISISCGYSLLGKVKSEIYRLDASVENISYSEQITITAAVPVREAEDFAAAIIDKTNGSAEIEFLGISYQKK